MEQITQISWEGLANPVIVGSLALLVMVFLGKPLINEAFARWWIRNFDDDIPDHWPLRSLVTNLVTWVVCFAFSAWRLQPVCSSDWGAVTVNAIIGLVTAIAGYEQLKNVLGTFGVDLKNYSPFS